MTVRDAHLAKPPPIRRVKGNGHSALQRGMLPSRVLPSMTKLLTWVLPQIISSSPIQQFAKTKLAGIAVNMVFNQRLTIAHIHLSALRKLDCQFDLAVKQSLV